MKSIKATFWCFKFLNVCIIPLYKKLELIAMNKLGKVWFHNTFLVKFHGCSVRNFKSLKQLYFPTILIFKIKLQLIGYLNLWQVRWFVTWSVESSFISSDSNLTQKIIRETIEVEKKKRWIKTEFWHIPELMAHFEDDLYFRQLSFLLLKNDSIKKKILP